MARAGEEAFRAAMRTFANSLRENFAAQVVAQPEDQLKSPLKALLETADRALGTPPVVVRTETPLPGIGRPDAGVVVAQLLCGHVELKPPGTGARTERYRGHDREQWRKFKALPNLLYTDGNEWALYRSGQRAGAVVRFSGDVTADGEDAVTPEQAQSLADMLRLFLAWEPIHPSSPRQLAEMLAPLCRMLRDTAQEALQREGSRLRQLASDWRRLLFPQGDDKQFADAYAQTLTYAMLLARFEGATEPNIPATAARLDRGHGLLAQALRVLADPQVRPEIQTPAEVLERAIFAVDPNDLRRTERELWLYFYEDFLAAYDARLRRDSGVYYTPAEVVRAQVTLVSQLLRERFGKPLAFADDGVIFLDPAAGTGTYPLAAMQHGLDLVRRQYGAGAVGSRATVLGGNMHAFELLVGPYAVAHLRLTEELLGVGGTLPPEGAHVYLTDTLESPHREPPGQQILGLFHRPLAEEHRRAQQVKASTRVLVCMGNPPYDREQRDPEHDPEARRKGGWVRHGDEEHGISNILEDFLAPARAARQGVHLKNLYNDYVYFWRWALWKVFETTGDKGIVCFITASSYLRGPGFVGMREVMRRTFDELWIIDLEGDNLGARKTENVFAIQIPVAIALGVRYGVPHPDVPASVRYAKLTGTREEKLSDLAGISGFSSLPWRDCYGGWQEPFLPAGEGDYFNWPALTDLFPWQHTGVETKRTWIIAESKEILISRWQSLKNADQMQRDRLFHETRDRRVNRSYPSLQNPTQRLVPISNVLNDDNPEALVRYGFRSFERKWLLADGRLADYLRPAIWHCYGANQLFITSMLTGVLGLGPAAVITHLIPDRHHFRGSYSGKDVIPLWRDAAATEPNVAAGLLERLAVAYGAPVTPEDLFGYVYALLATPAYVDRFSEELTIPGPRIPLTRDCVLFRAGAALGRRLVWLHTYGERWAPDGEPVGAVPSGLARCTVAVPEQPERYPEAFEYEEATHILHVGDGAFAPVSPEVWNFSVSGLEVVQSWLAYRMKGGAGRRSSPLDEIRPERWSAQLTEELLQLLWVLEATTGLFPALSEHLRAVVEGPLFTAAGLPTPTEVERRPPAVEAPEVEQVDMELEELE
jgi:hypothetical protein